MKSLRLSTLLLVLAVSLTVACSNNEGRQTHTPHMDKEISETKTQIGHEAHEEHLENETPQITRSADSHMHGGAELAVVLENGGVTIELDSPLFNILGFEHAPTTDAQKARVKQAETQLGRSAELFTFNKEAGCTAASKDKKVRLFAEHHDDHVNEDEHEHGEDKEDSGHDEDTHKDVLTRYEFDCQNPASLSYVSVNLFEFFDELSVIDVTYIGPSKQSQHTLTGDKSKMDITQ